MRSILFFAMGLFLLASPTLSFAQVNNQIPEGIYQNFPGFVPMSENNSSRDYYCTSSTLGMELTITEWGQTASGPVTYDPPMVCICHGPVSIIDGGQYGYWSCFWPK